jgi:putative polyhydroxyalkanoate system protein
MNLISINHSHSLDKDTACHRAEQMLEELANSYGLNIESTGDGNIVFSGSGISGNVEIDHDEISITAKLSFLMIAMKTVIANEIKNKLDDRFS